MTSSPTPSALGLTPPLYCGQHREFDGLVFPTRRRVLPRGPGGLVLPRPTLLALDFDEVKVEVED
jgi:hypothetical protein